jgi:rubredoxin-NAD+ reductase
LNKPNSPLIIIGTGLAGYSLVREIRKLDSDLRILMLTADDGVSYSKPMLSNGYSKGKTADQLAVADVGQMVSQLRVEVRTFTRVTAVDPARKMVLVGTEEISYHQLVFAAGADVINPELTGSGLAKVFSVNDLMDYRRIRKALEHQRRVAILGAGLIGCEFANDLLNGGLQPEIIAPCTGVLPGLLPIQAGNALQKGLESAGVKFHLERYVAEISADSDGVTLSLDNGDTVKADLVLSAIGLRPRTGLAESAGIKCGKGIIVDRTLQTSANDIFALGDCAEVDGHSLFYVLPLMASAKALAKTLTGNTTMVSYGVMPVTVKTPACPVVVCPPPPQPGEWQIHIDTPVDLSAKYLSPRGDLLGFALTGKAGAEKQILAKQVPPLHS